MAADLAMEFCFCFYKATFCHDVICGNLCCRTCVCKLVQTEQRESVTLNSMCQELRPANSSGTSQIIWTQTQKSFPASFPLPFSGTVQAGHPGHFAVGLLRNVSEDLSSCCIFIWALQMLTVQGKGWLILDPISTEEVAEMKLWTSRSHKHEGILTSSLKWN